MDSLAQKPTVGHVKRALQSLPMGLDETYKQALIRIQNQGKDSQELAKKVLSWVVHAKRILSTSEFQHAITVEFGQPELDEQFVPDIATIGSICAGLVTIDTQSDVVRLVHYTTQEYLERKAKIWFPKVETYIAMSCVTYLSFKTFESGFCQSDEEFEERLRLNPLYDYAARNWGHHARTAPLEVGQSMLDFLLNEAKISASAQALMAGHEPWEYSQNVPRGMIGVHLAAYFGLRGVMTALLKNRHHLNAKDESGRTPLSWAAQYGHKAVVKLLLKKGAKLESWNIFGQTPLSWAAECGHKAVVKLLLDNGASLESNDISGHTPLLGAIAHGHEAVVKLLLHKGSDIQNRR